MRKRNANFNNTGKVSCLLLLLLAFLAVNPISRAEVFAEEGEDNNTEEATDEVLTDDEGEESDDVLTNIDDEIELYTTTPSTMSISFSPASGSASMTPTTSAGASAQINVLATVSVSNSDGYSVYLKGSNANLVGKNNSSNIIPGATTAKTYANMDVNTWGYNASEGTAVPTGATYKAITVSSNGEKIAENTNKKISSDTKKIMLSFAAKVNDTKPADTYQNTVTMSVVSSPLQTTLSDLTNMQDMDSATCSASAMYETKQLRDTRDGKYYWVTKLADGKCWMTQNLDLDLSTGTALTPSTSDVSSNWTPGRSTATIVSSSTTCTDGEVQQCSWSLGDTDSGKDARITNPNTPTDCGSKKASAASCTSQFALNQTVPMSANGDTNAHYLLGNHYLWYTATAGTGGSITSGQATSSVCAKGWRLPDSTSSGEFAALVASLGGASSTNIVTQPPFYAVRGGTIAADSLFDDAGYDGDYWSSTPSSDVNFRAYTLRFNGASYVNPSFINLGRGIGTSVRCVAR